MSKRKEDGILFLLGVLFFALGSLLLLYYYYYKVYFIIGDVMINSKTTGFFLFTIGILSVLLHYLNKK